MRCPQGFGEDAPRAEAVVARLRALPEGSAILAKGPLPPICFGPAPVSVVTTQGTMLLQGDLEEPEAAARMGHLLLHTTEGHAADPPRDGDCAAYVDRALRGEARAIALELRLRRAAGTKPSAWAFEAPFWAAPEPDREGLILEYLRAHPDGAPGLDGLASGYARRCKRAQDP